MIGAMYENGGNTTQRFLDGHPELYVYPFESQIGTRRVSDAFSGMFPAKYRWPVFALDASPEADYRDIIDEEGKVRARTPHVSKFRHVPFDLSGDERCAIYTGKVRATGRSRANNVAAFYQATFEAWKDFKHTGAETMYVGYSPIIVIDAAQILDDMPGAHVLHVVRNPWSAYADTKKRPVPLSLDAYMIAWTVNQFHALALRERYPDRLHIVRAEDVMADPVGTLGGLTDKLGLSRAKLTAPSWNRSPLEQVYPWGTIRTPTPEANRATAAELSDEERDRIAGWAWQYLDVFDLRGSI
jgi:hypothetical protein